MIITIDGPAGAGKSSVALSVAKILNITRLDTGSIYRCISYSCLQNNTDTSKEAEVKKVLEIINLELKQNIQTNSFDVYLNGVLAGNEIRTPQIGTVSSEISKYLSVRSFVNSICKNISLKFNIVTEGRDQGSEVFKNADFKIFLTASPHERAKRRLLELRNMNINETYDNILKQIISRDKNDTERAVAPLIVPENAFIIDSSDLTPDEVVKKIIQIAGG